MTETATETTNKATPMYDKIQALGAGWVALDGFPTRVYRELRLVNAFFSAIERLDLAGLVVGHRGGTAASPRLALWWCGTALEVGFQVGREAKSGPYGSCAEASAILCGPPGSLDPCSSTGFLRSSRHFGQDGRSRPGQLHVVDDAAEVMAWFLIGFRPPGNDPWGYREW